MVLIRHADAVDALEPPMRVFILVGMTGGRAKKCITSGVVRELTTAPDEHSGNRHMMSGWKA